MGQSDLEMLWPPQILCLRGVNRLLLDSVPSNNERQWVDDPRLDPTLGQRPETQDTHKRVWSPD